MCKVKKNQGPLALHSMEQARNDHLITTDEKMQHDIYRKKIGFEVLRKVDRGTRHNWHTRLRKTFLLTWKKPKAQELTLSMVLRRILR